jgi:putative ABC transport system substrate-binding protein
MQFDRLKRRECIALLGSAAAAWPLAGHAQQGERIRRIGWLDPAPETDPGVPVRKAVVQQGLERTGWSIGRNLAIDYRWGVFDLEQARRAGAELVRLSPDVILCAASPAVQALQEITRSVPIVFVAVAEPVAQGFTAVPKTSILRRKVASQWTKSNSSIRQWIACETRRARSRETCRQSV